MVDGTREVWSRAEIEGAMADALASQETSVSKTRVALAWGVHLFTASGAVVGAAALLATGAGQLRTAALLMLVALFIDAVDGTLARRVGVHDVLPEFDGRRLDDMVDYLNYVIVAVVFLVASGSLPSWVFAVPPVLASAYGFSHAHAKTEDGFFLGFPSYWNVVALYVWLLGIPAVATVVLVLLLSVLVFVPIKYLYPSQIPVLRRTTNLAGGVWFALLCVAVAEPTWSRELPLLEISLLFPVYYMILSLWVGGFHRSGSTS